MAKDDEREFRLRPRKPANTDTPNNTGIVQRFRSIPACQRDLRPVRSSCHG